MNVRAACVVALVFLGLFAALAVVATPADANIVLLSTSAGPPSPQDANLYDWQGQWTSALDRAAPVPGQLPGWQVNVGLFGNQYEPPDESIVEEDPTCLITLQIDGAPPVGTNLDPCVQGPYDATFFGARPPIPELLTPNLSAASNGPHTVTVTAYTEHGYASSTSFNVLIDNVLPSPTSMVGAAGWERGGETVSSTATTSGPSGIDGQYCSIGSAPTSWYPGTTASLAITGNGQIPVSCTAQNNAGVTGPSTEYDALVDNSPPVGYFAPRDPNNPDQVAVDVADSLSGVAGGQVQIQTFQGWQTLATSYSPSTGQLTATIPDSGSLPDGNYTLRAVVSDAVGNTATVTSDADGTPEVVTEPVRIVTRLPVGRSRALVKRCTVTRIRVHHHLRYRHRRRARHQRPAGRLVRHCAKVSVPRKGATARLRFGQDARVSGLLQTADGTPVAGAQVQVSEQAAGWHAHPVGTVTSNAQGRFRYTIAPGPSRRIIFTYPGSPTLRASLGRTRVRVIGKTKIKVSRRAHVGGRLRVSGRVLGGFITHGGVLVQLQYLIRGLSPGWSSFHTPVRTDDRGRWSATFPIARGAAGHTYRLRALVPRQGAWPFMTTHSKAIARAIR